jgi:hypothetical protein
LRQEESKPARYCPQMAHKVHNPESSPPSSLPPETTGIDLNWDDDPASVGARSVTTARPPAAEDVDIGDRVTAVPDIPISELNARLLADAERATDPPPSLAPTRPGVALGGARSRDGSGTARGAPTLDTVPPLPTEPPPPLDSMRAAGDSFPHSSGPPADGYRRTEPAPPTPGLDLDEVGHEDPGAPSAPPGPRAAASARGGAAQRARVDRQRRELRDRYAVGDFSGALEIAESLLELDARDADALRYAESCREVLLHMLTARVGDLGRVVRTVVAPDQIRWLSLDHRAGFFLSLVDGMSTADELLDISGMTRLDALRILSHLLEQNVVVLDPGHGHE